MVETRDAYSKISAADYNENLLGGAIKEGMGEEGEAILAWMNTGGYCLYKGIDFGTVEGASGCVARVKTSGSTGWIEIRLDSPSGRKIGMLLVDKRETGEGWSNVVTGIYGAKGVHDVYLVFITNTRMMEVNWFKFSQDLQVDGAFDRKVHFPIQVPYLGPAEDNFLGCGIAGAGGNTDGIWNYLVGPAYSCPSFIKQEEIRIIVDGREYGLGRDMRRARGTGIFYSVAEIEGLVVYLADFANMGRPWVARMVMVENPTGSAHKVTSSPQ